VAPRDGWWPLDDESEWEALLFSRWPVLGEDLVRGPPGIWAQDRGGRDCLIGARRMAI